ncbi:DNA-directed DNA polymerase [Giardia duodenalis]|uniref:DNA polymerase kappa n=1 Tax=Giardia intestinalis (strain ATCC 50803 / WB clone C6) TaxID=184922 RepID=A8BDY9_GIAIC|nr:DINP protein human, muc B family [Giardia intestinalis]KAE8305868.1 DNA-directed DNA polymerase [Giardia intestinalis]|eukprot:XP_001707550.1 DINP protein human, muc B family [Giardia lamblia ATCC 50803]
MNRNGLLDGTKAGLASIDRDTINKIIARETQGTAKFLRMREKEQASCVRSALLAQRASALTPQAIREETLRVDRMIAEATQNLRGWQNVIAVLDFDCFYASIEERDNPSLRGKPVIITGGSIVCTSNYAARKYGVRSAMPTHVAKALCKDVIAIPASMEKYMSVSHAAAEVFAGYDTHYSMHGLDECVFNLTAYMKQYAHERYGVVDMWSAYAHLDKQCADGALSTDADSIPLPAVQHTNTLFKEKPGFIELLAAEVVSAIRKDIASRLGITCSVGVAINQQVAKILTELNKPDGQTIGPLHTVTQDNYSTILHSHLKDLHIRKIWGVGDASAQLLSREPFMITSIGDIFLKRGLLSLLLTPAQAKFYIFASVGLSSVQQLMDPNNPNPKSVGQECTFPETSDEDVLKNILRNLCKLIAQKLQEQNLVPTRLNVKVRFADWIEKTHVVDLSRHSWDLDVLYLAALEALRYIQKCKTDEVGYPMSTGNSNEGVGHGRSAPYLTVGFGIYRRLARCVDIRLLGVAAHTFRECQDSNSGSVLYQLSKAGAAHRNCTKNCAKAHSVVHIDHAHSEGVSDTEVIIVSSSSPPPSSLGENDYYPSGAFKTLKSDFTVRPTKQGNRATNKLSNFNKTVARHKATRIECAQKPKIATTIKEKRSFVISSKPLHNKFHRSRSST